LLVINALTPAVPVAALASRAPLSDGMLVDEVAANKAPVVDTAMAALADAEPAPKSASDRPATAQPADAVAAKADEPDEQLRARRRADRHLRRQWAATQARRSGSDSEQSWQTLVEEVFEKDDTLM
jgi:hypothetical protein